MSHQPTRRPPYFDWPLDRWKIGLALLLWLGLIFFSPAPSAPLDPQGASPVARPGQRPLVGASTQIEPTATVPPLTESPPSPLETPHAEAINRAVEVVYPDAAALLTLAIWEPGRTPLRNSTPLFYGQTEANGLVEILLEGRRYQVQADDTGYWQFAPSAPLPVGMTWVQVRQVDVDGTLLSPTISQMALVGADATPVSAPGILTPFSLGEEPPAQTPDFFGIGPAGVKLIFYAQVGEGEDAFPVWQETVGGDGMWSAPVSIPLTAGKFRLWAVAVDDAGKALSRSWPIERDITPQAKSPLLDATPITQ